MLLLRPRLYPRTYKTGTRASTSTQGEATARKPRLGLGLGLGFGFGFGFGAFCVRVLFVFGMAGPAPVAPVGVPPQVDARSLALITDDIHYLYVAAHSFQAFLQDTSLGRRDFGRRTADLLAIQAFVPVGSALSPDLAAFFFNSAQKEVIRRVRPSVTQADLDVYFPAPPALAVNAQDILVKLDQPLVLRALAHAAGRGGAAFGGGGSGGGGGGGRSRRYQGEFRSGKPAGRRGRGGARSPSRASSRRRY